MSIKSTIGKSWAFLPELDTEAAESSQMVSDDEDIRKNLWLLLNTSPGERVDRPEWGCPIREYALETIDAGTETLLRDVIQKAVAMCEPRIKLDRVLFTSTGELGVLYIELQYTVLQTNRRTNMIYTFYFVEGVGL